MTQGFSKVLGCQSWRVGYAVSAPTTVDALMRIADPIYICAPWLQLAIAEYLSEHYDDFRRHKADNVALMRRNWRVLSEAFRDTLGWAPIEPAGSMYGLFRHGAASDMAATLQALQVPAAARSAWGAWGIGLTGRPVGQAGVGVCPGSMFFAGQPANTGYTRIHCGIAASKADQVVRALREWHRSVRSAP